MAKQRYRVANWAAYNRSLVNRGSLSLWWDHSPEESWLMREYPKRKGRRFIYSNSTILAIMSLKALFGLPYRALEGLVSSLLAMAHLKLPVPSYQQIQRRAAKLTPNKALSTKRPTDIVIDASGIKVYGEGEWQAERKKQKGKKKWMKIHVAVDPKSGEIIVEEVTDSASHDSSLLPKLIKKCPRSVKCAYADGAYDTFPCYEALHKRGIEGRIPPRDGAVTHPEGPSALLPRNKAILALIALGCSEDALKLWKKLVSYGKRALVETAFSRFKRCFGERLWSRLETTQSIEVRLKWGILNTFTRLGRPESYAI